MITTFWSALILLAILIVSIPVIVLVSWVMITWSNWCKNEGEPVYTK